MDINQDSAQVLTKETKFCKECGEKIAAKAEICPKCGCRVEAPATAQSPQIVINNSNQNQNINQTNTPGARAKNKWTAFLLCLFLGSIGAHKFYEGKIGMGILYLFTVGLFGIGAFIDLIIILCKPNPYYVLWGMKYDMFENNDFFSNTKNHQNEPQMEVKLPNVNGSIIFGIISSISSAIGFAMMFGGYSILNISEEIANRPFANIKLMIFVALIMFSLSAIVFGILGILNYFKNGKNSAVNTISTILSVFGIILGLATTVMSFIFFFIQ